MPTERALALFLVLTSALLATALTNDIALFIVVPLTLSLRMLAQPPIAPDRFRSARCQCRFGADAGRQFAEPVFMTSLGNLVSRIHVGNAADVRVAAGFARPADGGSLLPGSKFI